MCNQKSAETKIEIRYNVSEFNEEKKNDTQILMTIETLIPNQKTIKI